MVLLFPRSSDGRLYRNGKSDLNSDSSKLRTSVGASWKSRFAHSNSAHAYLTSLLSWSATRLRLPSSCCIITDCPQVNLAVASIFDEWGSCRCCGSRFPHGRVSIMTRAHTASWYPSYWASGKDRRREDEEAPPIGAFTLLGSARRSGALDRPGVCNKPSILATCQILYQ